MRFFWHTIIAVITLAVLIALFWFFALNRGNRITFTDDLPDLTSPTVTVADPTQGPVDAPITLVVFADFECQACAEAETILDGVLAAYPNHVRLVWKDLPNTSTHPEALSAALAARCAEKQDAFFAYADLLFANQENLGPDLYPALAENLGLKTASFNRCLENQETLPLVQKSYDEGLALNVTATPTVFINDERLTGSLNRSELDAKIRAALADL